MTNGTSARRQNELLRELSTLNEDYAQRRQEIEANRDQRLAEIKSRHTSQQQATSSRLATETQITQQAFQQESLSTKQAFTGRLQIVTNEFNEKLAASQNAAKTAKSDGEYDWFLSKQRLKKEYEADKVAAQEEYKKHKTRLKAHGSQYSDQVAMAKDSFARHRCEFKVQGGDLLEDPGPGDHLADHLQTVRQIDELIVQFRRVFWVRFQEDRWYVIAFMLGLVAAVYPLQSVFNNYAITGAGSAAVGLLVAGIAYFVSRAMATKCANQFQPSIVSAIANGKKQLLSAQHQNKSRRETQLARLRQDTTTREKELDEEWKERLLEIDNRTTYRAQELKTWHTKQANAIDSEHNAKQTAIHDHFQPRLADLQSQLTSETKRLSDERSAETTAVESECTEALDQLTENWKVKTSEVRNALNEIVEVASQSIVTYDETFSNWSSPSEPLDSVQFGTVSTDSSFDDTKLPATMDLVRHPSLMVECNSRGRELATQTLKVAMVRLLTAIPVGKLRFTIVDPVGLGQDFSAFMHLADHDEQLVNHRIWTETGHINARLSDLTQHMENIIQTYLRNEFDSIQQYNQNAGEVAEAFRVLVVANFPAGFSDEGAARLLSIVKSGPRCGVFTLTSVDPNQKLPRNFDLEELRNSANVIVADDDLRWEESPLSDFPIQLHSLPTESRFSEIMHVIGGLAKTANRVEVPFSAVAPQESDWWQADGRSEIAAELGRAGAMKLQSMKLGHGTSQHVLISGKTGSGKSTLLHAMITGLALKYAPTEVQFYLIDFKKGVEFKSYAEHRLPHARVIAIESEREFGQSVLQRLDAELRRRGDLFRRVGVQSLAGYRDARPDEHMPRILLVIDEFQEFFVKEDKIAQEASLLLDRLVRQGRAFGIHVILGSQTLAGAYSLARATIGQMAVRVALQCSATDAHLILSDDNDAARLLRRPGEAIYNDANGMVEGNHPFQVVWLPDNEKEDLLRRLAEKHAATESAVDTVGSEDEFAAEMKAGPIVFEGNTAADIQRNPLFLKSWNAPAPTEIPLAPRAWLGEAIAIKEAPATVFHRRSGANLLLVGQQEESAMGVMASSLLSLAAFSPTDASKQSKFVILDGTRPEAREAGYWNRLHDSSGMNTEIVKPREAKAKIHELATEVNGRSEADSDDHTAIFVFIYNLSRFRDLQKSDDDFGFGGFGEEKSASAAEDLAGIIRNGPARGVHTILWSDTHTNLMRWIDRQSLRDMSERILFQMSATDSSNLMDSSAASQLGVHRGIYYSEDQGRAERFRPYGLPSEEFLSDLGQRGAGLRSQSRTL